MLRKHNLHVSDIILQVTKKQIQLYEFGGQTLALTLKFLVLIGTYRRSKTRKIQVNNVVAIMALTTRKN